MLPTACQIEVAYHRCGLIEKRPVLDHYDQNWEGETWSNNGGILESTDYTLPGTIPGGDSDEAWAFYSSDSSPLFEPKLRAVYR